MITTSNGINSFMALYQDALPKGWVDLQAASQGWVEQLPSGLASLR